MKTLGFIFLCPGLLAIAFPETGFCVPGTCDLVISEIMADPNPAVGLPDAEYLEIYNRSASSVVLEGFILILGGHRKTLQSARLEAGGYMIICDAEDEGLFASMGSTLPVDHMPAILNTGTTLALESPSGCIIHCVEFTDKWYRSSIKEGGGWSLEIIDPDNPCGRADNWCASTDPQGGTPGGVNSVNAKNPDDLMPKLLRAAVNQDRSVALYFNESMDSISLMDPLEYYATHGLFHPLRVDPVGPAFSTLNLYFGNDLDATLTYSITLLNTLKDCAGNPVSGDAQADFAIPEPADSFDVIINELLFDAPPGVSEFVELCNRSEKVIDLSSFSLALCDVRTDSVTRMVSLKDSPFLLFPHHYAVITRNGDLLPDPNHLLDFSNVIEQPELFILPDKEGEIEILSHDGHIVDRFFYNPSMHSAFFSENEGISLERIQADLPTNDISNWYSAATENGYSTPGYENSQEISPASAEESILVSPAVFSPDGDGNDDLMFLTIQPGGAGFMGNIMIYNLEGRRVKTLFSNGLLAAGSVLTWDGTENDNREALIGIYLVYIEIYDQHGIIKKFRKVVTLARRLLLIK